MYVTPGCVGFSGGPRALFAVACESFLCSSGRSSCGMMASLPRGMWGPSPLVRDPTRVPYIGRQTQ